MTPPVTVRLAMDPPLTSYVSANSSVRVHVAVTDPVTQVPVAPDALVAAYMQPPIVDVPVTIVPVLDSAGAYHFDQSFNGVVGEWSFFAEAQSTDEVPVGQGSLRVTTY